jgi:hypothetical protein
MCCEGSLQQYWYFMSPVMCLDCGRNIRRQFRRTIGAKSIHLHGGADGAHGYSKIATINAEGYKDVSTS